MPLADLHVNSRKFSKAFSLRNFSAFVTPLARSKSLRYDFDSSSSKSSTSSEFFSPPPPPRVLLRVNSDTTSEPLSAYASTNRLNRPHRTFPVFSSKSKRLTADRISGDRSLVTLAKTYGYDCSKTLKFGSMACAVPSKAAKARKTLAKVGGSRNPLCNNASVSCVMTAMKSFESRIRLPRSSNTFVKASTHASSSASLGKNSNVFKSLTKDSASRLTKPINPRIMALRWNRGTWTHVPKSKYTKAPCSSTIKFPGCGSACMKPDASS